MDLEISGISSFGQGFALNKNTAENSKKHGKKIFVSGTIPGDKVTCQITKENSKFIAAKLTKITSPSKHRSGAPCLHFENCGGCNLQHLKEDYYQEFKKKILTDTLNRSKIDFSEEINWHFINKNSRRRVNFKIDQDNRLGFFRENSNDVVKIDQCLVLEKELSDLIGNLQNLLQKNQKQAKQQYQINGASLTKFDNGVAVILSGEINPDLETSQDLIKFAQENKIISLACKNNDEQTFFYQTQIPQLFFGDVKIDLQADIFMQATKDGQEIILKEINNHIATLPKKIKIADLYCGIGTYSFGILAQNKNVHIEAFEGSQKMINLLNKNAKQNTLKNHLNGNAKDLVQDPVQSGQFKDYDLAIINPPRNGGNAQIKNLAKSAVKNIIYASCNPAAFASDAKILLENGYKINKITAIDQFAYTHHLELVAVFTKNT